MASEFKQYFRENGLRLLIQVVIFLFYVTGAYFLVKQDIALLKQQVNAVEESRKQDRADILQNLRELRVQIDDVKDLIIALNSQKKGE